MDSYRWRVVATERRWRRRLSLKRFWSTRFPVAIVAQRAIVNRDFRTLLLLSLSLLLFLRSTFPFLSYLPVPSPFLLLTQSGLAVRPIEPVHLNFLHKNRISLDGRTLTIKLVITYDKYTWSSFAMNRTCKSQDERGYYKFTQFNIFTKQTCYKLPWELIVLGENNLDAVQRHVLWVCRFRAYLSRELIN